MKKTLFLLVALVVSMSMNAQNGKIMKVLAGETVLLMQEVNPTIKVVFEEATTGTASRSGNVEVKWVQLWENGPKFAEYNVGAANNKAEDYGGYYCWGSSIDKDPKSAYKSGTDPLTGTDDTATNLWGDNWRMPTRAEFQALLDNCDVEWTTVGGVNGYKFTGKADPYKSNRVFLPAAGYCALGSVGYQGSLGNYWTSTPYESKRAYYLDFNSDGQEMHDNTRLLGCSMRAVLKE